MLKNLIFVLILQIRSLSIAENCLKKCRNQNLNDDLEVLQCQTKCMFQEGIEQAQYSELLQDVNLYELPDNYCLNNIEANSYKQKLAFFNQGPCQPLVLLPGIFSTKLIVEIDCEDLKENDPELFEQCGWTDCEKEFYEVWKKVPLEEYRLWINDFTSPMNFFGSFQENLCFSKIFRSKYDFSRPFDQWIIEKKGIRVRASGFTKGTQQFGRCGADSISNLLPTPVQLPQTIAFGKLIRQLERIGYVSGLTYQTLPYNFYYSIFQNEGSINLKSQIKRLYDLSGKKVSIIAHSNGNMITLYTLATQFNKKEKEKYIKNYISLAAPFIGAYQANRYLIGGNPDYIHAQDYIGFSWDASKIFLDGQASLYFFLMKNYKKLYEGEQWFEKIKKRLHYEQNDDVPFSDSGIDFWPKKEDQCYRKNVKQFSKKCLLEFENPEEDFMFIGYDKYNLDNFIKALKKYNNEQIVLDLYDRLGSVNLGKLNPGVPVFVVYQAVQSSDYKLFFAQDYQESVTNNTYPTLDFIQTIKGDGSVNLSSTLLPALRWALKSDEGDPDYKKVTFIEMCSIQNQAIDYYDTIEEDGSKTFSKNRYIGVHCKCSEDEEYTYNTCKHNSLISDDNFVKLALKLINTNAIGTKEQFIKIQDMDEQELQYMAENCYHYEHDVYNYHEQKNFFHLRRDFCWYEKKNQFNFIHQKNNIFYYKIFQINYKKIYNGSGYTKIGFSEDENLRLKLPTIIGKPKYQNEILDFPYDQKLTQKKQKKKFQYTSGIIGDTALNSPSIYNLNFPIKNGIIQDQEELLDLYFYIYFNELQLEPSKFPLLLTQNLMTSNNCRKKLMEICFESLKVPILGISYQTNFALKGTGRLTGLVLDSGYGGSQVVPIVEDYFLNQGVQYKSFLGGQTLNELIQDYLSRCKIYELDIFRDFKLIEKIKQQFCQIKQKNENFQERFRKTTTTKTLYNENPKSGKICELPDGSIADLGLIPDITTDLFFNNHILGFEGNDFVQMILKAVQDSDIDYRKELFQSIIFSGGNQKIQGMIDVLTNELKKGIIKLIANLQYGKVHVLKLNQIHIFILNIGLIKKIIKKKEYID